MPHRAMRGARTQATSREGRPLASPVDTNLSQWMSDPQIQAKALSQVRSPGTHDSGTYALTAVLSRVQYDDISH